MNAFRTEIITPERVYFEGEAVSLVAPGALGYLGILAGHAPLVTPLAKGRVFVRLADRKEKAWEIEGGFLEVSGNHCLLLVEKIDNTAEEAIPNAV